MRSLLAAGSWRIRHRTNIALCASTLFLLTGSRAYVPESSLGTVGARAFVITDKETLSPFTFERVVASLTAGQTAAWLETLASTDRSPPRQVVMPLTGFIAAPEDGYWRPAGASWSYMRPIAIVNRFDLAPVDYANCGEYRVIFSQRTGGRARLHIAVESILPNPHPKKGRAGCAGIAAFWWDLASTESDEARRRRLEHFFFQGLPPFSPVLDRQSFEKGGRIRTSEIGDGRPKFAQFELKRLCGSAQLCVPSLTRVPLDNMPDAALFDADSGERAASFRRDFLRQIASLSVPDVNRYSMNIDRAYSVMDVEALVPAFNYRLPFRRSLQTRVGQEFRAQIAGELRKAGSTLTPEEIIDRAETQNCAGCHGKPGPVGGGLVFPKAFEHGEHIADESLVKSARLSPAVVEVFVPHRIDVLRQYLRTDATASEPLPRSNERAVTLLELVLELVRADPALATRLGQPGLTADTIHVKVDER